MLKDTNNTIHVIKIMFCMTWTTPIATTIAEHAIRNVLHFSLSPLFKGILSFFEATSHYLATVTSKQKKRLNFSVSFRVSCVLPNKEIRTIKIQIYCTNLTWETYLYKPTFQLSSCRQLPDWSFEILIMQHRVLHARH